MMRVSPPEDARELPGPQASSKVTRAPSSRRWSAVQPPNAPAPMTAICAFAFMSSKSRKLRIRGDARKMPAGFSGILSFRYEQTIKVVYWILTVALCFGIIFQLRFCFCAGKIASTIARGGCAGCDAARQEDIRGCALAGRSEERRV